MITKDKKEHLSLALRKNLKKRKQYKKKKRKTNNDSFIR